MPKKTLDGLKQEYINSCFGLWTVTDVVYRTISTGRNRSYAKVTCECGSVRETVLRDVILGKSTNCGCLRKASAIERGKRCRIHGMSGSVEFRLWGGMLNRCNNPNDKGYPNYGGRGISVCDRWKDAFLNFYADMGARPEGCSIERIDNDKGYSPDNCKWASAREQANNRRNNVIVVYHGEQMTLSQAAGMSQHPYATVLSRFRSGWNIDDAVDTPLKQIRKQICITTNK